MNDSQKAEAMPKEEFLMCNEGYVFYRDPTCSPKWVKLFNEDGRLVAMIPNVHKINVGPLPR